MRAMIYSGGSDLDGLRLEERPAPPVPGAGEVSVRVHASSLNYHDYLVVRGQLGAAAGRIPLSDAGGVVTAVGARVRELGVGDAVVSCFFPEWQAGLPPRGDFSRTPGDGIDGFARETVTTTVNAFTRAPRGWSHAEAATITTAGVTAWRALVVNGGLKAGDSVLLLGTGGVSIYALQIAKAMGATVIHTTSSPAKAERLLALGADHVINYRATPAWATRVLELTGGRGVDHVVEVGGAGTLPQSIEAVALGGHVAVIGVLAGLRGEFPTALLLAKQCRLQGIGVGSRADQLSFVRALEATGLRPVIDRHFALPDLADAFRYEASGEHFGKIAIDI